MRRLSMCMLYAALVLALPAYGQQTATTWVDVSAVQQSTDVETIAAALTRHGYPVKRTQGSDDHKTHIQLGPYTAATAEAVRAKIAAEGFTASVTVAPVPAVATAPGGLTPEQQRLEAEAMAKFGGAPSAAVPSSSADLEAQALAKLGLAPERKGPQTPAEREADALRAMQANTAKAENDAENRRQAQLIAEQQAEADRLQREIAQSEAQSQVNSAPQQSTAANIINGLSAVIAGATASMAQNQAGNDSINQALQQQQAKLRGLQQQIAANQAAEQARQLAVAAQSRQQAADQAKERAAEVQRPIAPPLQRSSSLTASAPDSRGSGRCPSGGFIGGTYDGHPCDCRSNSAAYNCPSGTDTTRTPVVSVVLSQVNPSFSTQDNSGNVTLGTGIPRACATSPSGSQLPLTPGTTVGTCNPASCRGTGYSVPLVSKWTDATKTEVVGFFDNNSLGDVTCTWAFHKHGVWTEQGHLYLKFHDQHKGGRFGGVWANDTDSSDIKYACFEGIDPVDVQGKSCTQGVVFSGQTTAGTDK